jgi:SPP1 family predicted phage head-tail adaptor
MRIGRMRHRLEIQTATAATNDDYGPENVLTWAKKYGLWAELLPVSGNEQITALAAVGKQTMRFRTRYKPDVTTKMRVFYKGQAWDIAEVNPEDHQNQYLVILAVRGLTGGQ